MIKKLVCIVIIAIAVYSFYGLFFRGEITVGSNSFADDIPSYEELKKRKNELDSNITKLKQKNETELPRAVSNVEAEIKNYELKREEYENTALEASKDKIGEANREDYFLLDYLWIRVGNFANDNNVKFKMTPNEESSTITFDITGSYISVINFIYDLQNDPELAFVIDGVVIQGGQTVKANFTVQDVTVITSPDKL